MDAERRRRQRTGAALLTEPQVAIIKHHLFAGRSPRGLSEEYGVSLETIRRISRGDTWAWVVPATSAALFRLAAAPPTPDFDEEASVEVLSRLLNDIHAKKEGKVHTDQLLEDIKKEEGK